MDIDSNPLFTQDLFSLKKRLMAFSALTENAIRLCSAYERFKNEPYHLSLGMSILEEELICSRFLHKLFQFDIKTSTCDLKEIVLMITEITMDFFYSTLSIFQSHLNLYQDLTQNPATLDPSLPPNQRYPSAPTTASNASNRETVVD
jgi:hypothetical protein